MINSFAFRNFHTVGAIQTNGASLSNHLARGLQGVAFDGGAGDAKNSAGGVKELCRSTGH